MIPLYHMGPFASTSLWKSAKIEFEYPFLNKERGAGRERYMRQNEWLLLSACHAGRLADHPTPVVSVVPTSI